MNRKTEGDPRGAEALTGLSLNVLADSVPLLDSLYGADAKLAKSTIPFGFVGASLKVRHSAGVTHPPEGACSPTAHHQKVVTEQVDER